MNDIKQHSKEAIANVMKKQAPNLPFNFFLWSAGGAVMLSLAMKLLRKDDKALFVGHWVPTFLILGLYDKLFKNAGSDPKEEASRKDQ